MYVFVEKDDTLDVICKASLQYASLEYDVMYHSHTIQTIHPSSIPACSMQHCRHLQPILEATGIKQGITQYGVSTNRRAHTKTMWQLRFNLLCTKLNCAPKGTPTMTLVEHANSRPGVVNLIHKRQLCMRVFAAVSN